MQPPDPPDTVLAALVTLAVGSVAAVYQDAVLVVAGAAFGAALSLHRAPVGHWWPALWRVIQCIGLAIFLSDAAAGALWTYVPTTWHLSKQVVMAGVALTIAWSWPDSGALAWRAITAWIDRRQSSGADK